MCGLFDGGTGGIRTLGSLLSYVPLAREYFRPLSHRSVNQSGRGRFGTHGNRLVKYVLVLEEKFSLRTFPAVRPRYRRSGLRRRVFRGHGSPM